jgi:hypothetical protein
LDRPTAVIVARIDAYRFPADKPLSRNQASQFLFWQATLSLLMP